ncbi:MoaD/ThiS family protein [Georgenia sp. MJ206]|uniref:MoaD/ThiS family protein n=1 Tax=Georgenia wangjunii TaxID=3117730 RepID=UPI002F25FA11
MTTAGTDRTGGRAPGTARSTAVHVRYFAAAAEAAGTSAEDVVLPDGASAADLRAAAGAAHGPDLARVLAISSLLVDGVVRADEEAPLSTGPAGTPVDVDVLPPFAGG